MTEAPEYIVVGRFGRPRGVSGEIYVNLLTDNPDRLQDGNTFWMESEGGWKKIKIISVKPLSGRPAVKVEGIENPEDAAKLTNSFLYIKEAELPRLPEGKFYHFDLVGCRVVDEKNKAYGSVTGVEEYPANDVLVIESENGGRYLFPIVREYIKEIDTDGKKIVVDPPGGIFDSSDET